jgi:hypothetical protein
MTLKGIQSVKEETGSNAKKAVDFLNSFETNWNLSGDADRLPYFRTNLSMISSKERGGLKVSRWWRGFR